MLLRAKDIIEVSHLQNDSKKSVGEDASVTQSMALTVESGRDVVSREHSSAVYSMDDGS